MPLLTSSKVVYAANIISRVSFFRFVSLHETIITAAAFVFKRMLFPTVYSSDCFQSWYALFSVESGIFIFSARSLSNIIPY